MSNDLLTTATMRTAEKRSVDAGISLRQLMKNAGKAVAGEIINRYAPRLTLVLCGPGNNGGDGFVVARYLQEAGWPVRVMSTHEKSESYEGIARDVANEYSGEFESLATDKLDKVELVVDALFGTGLGKPIEGKAKKLIEDINGLNIPVVSVDIPSGVHGDSGRILGEAIQAELTVTFERARPGHFLLPGRINSGKVVVADIGIPHELLRDDSLIINSPVNWVEHLKESTPYDNKFTRGVSLIIGGSQMTGAVKLAASTSRRAGAGMSIIACSSEYYPLYGASALGDIVTIAEDDKALKELIQKRKVSAMLIGPGMLPNEKTRVLVLELLKEKLPLVIDGGALSAFQKKPKVLFEALHDEAILTPHEGEFTRLFPGVKDGELGKISRVREASTIAGCTVVLKGFDTVISNHEGECVINTNSSPTLATAGSGDVLAGIIVGLRAHVPNSFVAAQAGVWIHSAAGQSLGEGLIAEDLISELPRVWRLIRTNSAVAI